MIYFLSQCLSFVIFGFVLDALCFFNLSHGFRQKQQQQKKVARPYCVLKQATSSFPHIYLSQAKLLICVGPINSFLSPKRFCLFDLDRYKIY